MFDDYLDVSDFQTENIGGELGDFNTEFDDLHFEYNEALTEDNMVDMDTMEDVDLFDNDIGANSLDDYSDDDLYELSGEYDDIHSDDMPDAFVTEDLQNSLGDIEAGEAEAYINFDSDTADMDDVIGNPVDSMENWHVQEESDTCAVASQEFVLEDLIGGDFEESDLMNFAEENGWYDNGTPMNDVGNILEAMGLQVEKSTGNSLDDIEKCLANSGGVIVGVDSSEIWAGREDDFINPGLTESADHAIQVIGIDHSDPDNPMVIVNDSGVANGCGAMIPADIFIGAWEDSDCFMVEAYK